MREVDIIEKKKRGEELNEEELLKILSAPDYQLASFLMAVYFKGMSENETFLLTDIMRKSGDQFSWDEIPGIKVDKHSSGGVGDKLTLIVLPMAAALGVPIVKMSGRGLGFTGGTIDKLESIPGFRVDLSREEILDQVKRIGLALVSQSGNLTPLDKKLYALRDVTSTVDSLPLIAASVMSKKLAFGADAFVLDVKCGSGAFMKNEYEAKKLAELMCKIGNKFGKKTTAFITRMEEPLGRAVGNSLEIKEVLEFLSPDFKKPRDLYDLSICTAGEMAIAAGLFKDVVSAGMACKEVLGNGKALSKFKEFISAQGGDLEKLPEAICTVAISSDSTGFVSGVDARLIGEAAMTLGAGRAKLGDKIDYSCGILLKRTFGDYVKEDDVIFLIHTEEYHDNKACEEAILIAKKAFSFGMTPPPESGHLIAELS